MSHFSDRPVLLKEFSEDARRESINSMGEINYAFMFGWLNAQAVEFAIDSRQQLEKIAELREQNQQLRTEFEAFKIRSKRGI